ILAFSTTDHVHPSDRVREGAATPQRESQCVAAVMETGVTLPPNPAIDISAAVEKVFPGRKLRCGPGRRDPGGGGINVARVVRRLGAEVAAIYPAGGSTGKLLEH